MQYTDTLTKQFLTGGGSWNPLTPSTNPSRWASYEDPTYMGFYFTFNSYTRHDANNQDLDYFPQGLLLGTYSVSEGAAEDPDSAVSYLQRRGEYYRANMIKEFREGISYLADNTPWVFEKVTGMADIWKIDPKVNFRAKEKKIVFECNESINGRLTYLIDLYRKAAFDAEYMRYALPENQRLFSMDLIVTEIRWMGDVETATFLKFTFDECEFDFFSEGLSYLENLSTYAGEAAKVKIPITIGRIREVNSYGLLGGVLADTWSVYARNKETGKQAFTQNTTVKDGTGEFVARAFQDLPGYRGSDYTAGLSQRAQNQLQFNTDNAVAPDFGFLGNLATGLTASLDNLVSGFVNKGLLGNVYGFSLSGLGNALSGILNNPIAATQGLLNQSSLNQSPEAATLRNVNLSGPDIEFVKSSLGVILEISKVIPSDTLDKITIKDVEDYIKNTNASQNLTGSPAKESLTGQPSTTVGNPGKETLSGAPFAQSLLGSILLSGIGSSDGNPGKTILSEATVDRSVSPATESLNGIGSSDGNPGKTQLDDNGAKLDGNPGTEELIKPASVLLGAPGKEELNDNGAKIEGSLGKENLDDNGGSLDGSLSKEDLIDNGASLNSEGGNVELEAPTILKETPAPIEFNESPKSKLDGAAKVKLDGPKNTLEGELGKEPLEGQPKKNNPLGNVNLE